MAKVLFFALLLTSFCLAQTTYYIDQDATNTEELGTIAQPFKSIATLRQNLTTNINLNLIFKGSNNSYKFNDIDAILVFKNNISHLHIVGEANGKEVVFEGSNNQEYGIYINPNDASYSILNIEISNIRFKNFMGNALKIKGLSSKYVQNLKIFNCIFEGSIGSFRLTSENKPVNSANILVQYTSNIIIENNSLYSNADQSRFVESDGVYCQDVNGLTIRNNHIETLNIFGTVNTTPHVDCIQTYTTSNVIINNNILISKSNLEFYDHRSGIIMEGCLGYNKIYNNIIDSKSNNLINSRIENPNTTLEITNNTFIGENQDHLMNIYANEYYLDYLGIYNNIFFRDNTNASTIAIKFINIEQNSVKLPGKFDYNCYYSNGVSQNRVGSTLIDWNDDVTSFETNGIFADPIINTITYKISKYSPVKNIGKFVPTIFNDVI